MDPRGLAVPLLVTTLAGLLSVALAARPVGERALARFATRHGLTYTDANRPLVVAYLRRARLLRTGGGWLGAVIPWSALRQPPPAPPRPATT